MGTALGRYYSFGKEVLEEGRITYEKMQFWPDTSMVFLGFEARLDSRWLGLPEGKLEWQLRCIRTWHDAGGMTDRQRAKLAGFLVSDSPAFPLGRLFMAECMHAMKRDGGWDRVF